VAWELKGFKLGIEQLFSSTFRVSFQIDHQFSWDGSIMFFLEVDIFGISCLLQRLV
jgi:hypothetical protein